MEERGKPSFNPCRKPAGLVGQIVVRLMNSQHSKVTDWGLSHFTVQPGDMVLDIGCGGGRTIAKLAQLALFGKVYGVDHAAVAVSATKKLNAEAVRSGRVEILEASVSKLPFPDNMFDLVTAVETHFWWPDLRNDVNQVLRVLKPGGTAALIAEVYAGAKTRVAQLTEKHASSSGMKLLSVEQHRELLESAGFTDVMISTEARKGWICCTGKKPA